MDDPTSLLEQLKRSFAIVRKNRIYYLKGHALIFGLLLPAFLALSFSIGRNMPAEVLMPGLLGMAVFFTATSIGPGIMPFETRQRTLERLASAPISAWAMFLGDVLASFLFGLIISMFTVIIGYFLGVTVVSPLILGLSIVIAAFCFAAFGILLSVPPTDTPSTIMMLATVIKFPLIFISGIFIPISELSDWGRIVSSISPLTYFTDLARYCVQGKSYYPITLDFTVLLAFSVAFLILGVKLHERTLPKRLQ